MSQHETAAPATRVPAPRAQDTGPAVAHEVTIQDGRFCHAVCTCGWRSAGRRSRATARAEARDHALLYADGRVLP